MKEREEEIYEKRKKVRERQKVGERGRRCVEKGCIDDDVSKLCHALVSKHFHSER